MGVTQRRTGLWRIARHLSAVTVGASLIAVWQFVPSSLNLVSTTAAHLSWLLLAAALVWGPVHVLRHYPNPTNAYPRRDLGIWAALFGLLHFLTGLDEAMSPPYVERYVRAVDGESLRQALFGAGAWIGLSLGPVLVMLLLLSNDSSLRRLGPRWWKRLQRVGYAVFILAAAHGLVYQWLEERGPALVALFTGTLLGVVVLQALGFSRVRGRIRRR